MNSRIFFIGSLPYETPQEAIAFVKTHALSLPFLPQLPDANPQEDMIGQVLRGMELGFWDLKAASCLELFQNEFVDSPRYKIQVTGPLTMARALSASFVEIAPQWIKFWRGLRKQLKEAAFQGELWLQLDEPFWAANRVLPDGYTAFLQEIKKGEENFKLGIHSCATSRPSLYPYQEQLFDFFSFDFLKNPLTAKEEAHWSKLIEAENKVLVLGVIDKTGKIPPTRLLDFPNVWLSATCGLYGWKAAEVERVFSNLKG